MKTPLLFILGLMAFITVSSGTGYPKGGYMTLEELKNKMPSMQCAVTIAKSDSASQRDEPYNDFDFYPVDDKCLKRREINKDMWAYSDGNSLYMNCWKLKLTPGFSKVLTEGRYLVFYQYDWTEKFQKAQMTAGVLGGLIGTAIAHATMSDKTYKSLAVVDLHEAKRFYVDSGYMEKVVANHKEIKEEHQGKPGTSDSLALIYFNAINKKQ